VDDAGTLRRMLEIALALGAERRTEPMLRRILEAARELAGARYAAIGVPDGDGGFALFLTSGVDTRTWDLIGALPRTHGVLGALLASPTAIRMADIRADPGFGYYPKHHPVMRSFLGVPIVAAGEVLAELYLAEKIGAEKIGAAEFSEDDQRVVGMLAAHAALAVATAQRTERMRELSVAAERNRLARDLHDSITQTVFSLSLAAESAAAVQASDPAKLADQLDRVRLLSGIALNELRSLVETLRPPDVDADGLAAALRKRVALLRRMHDVPIALTIRGAAHRPGATLEREVLRVANEALANALQHAGASRVALDLEITPSLLRLVVTDDGAGFDLAGVLRSSRRLGLASMRERGQALGGNVRVDTAPGAGTGVTLEVPLAE
jgi:signal transduction histidine kinase